MIFNTLWTILLGVIGGIISSLIVSRVFLIQSEYQDQVRFVDRIIRKVGYISGFLHSAEAILKVSYDHNIQMEKEIKEKGYDYILFTDLKIKNTNWSVFPIPDEVLKLNVSDIKKQRYIKIHPHKFFRNYDLSLYIDANYVIKGDLDDYLINTLNPIDHIYIPHLQFGKGIKQAIEKAIEKKLDDSNLLKEVMDRYNKLNILSKSGIVNAGLIIRKHNTKDCIKLMEKWWEEVRDYSHVDGFAFNYAGYKTGVRFLYTSYQFALFYFNQTQHLRKIDYYQN